MLGIVVVLFDFFWWDGGQRGIASSGPFLLWATLISAQTAAWFVAFTAVWRIHGNISHPEGRTTVEAPRTPLRALWALARALPRAVSFTLLVWLIVVAVATTIAILLTVLWAHGHRELLPGSKMQAILVVDLVFLWLLAAVPSAIGAWRIRGYLKRPIVGTTVVMAVAILSVALTGALAPSLVPYDAFHAVHWRAAKITAAGLLGTAFALYALVGMWRIYGRVKTKLGEENSSGLDEVDTYLGLHENLQLLLVILGAMLGLTILAAAAERNVVTSYAGSQEEHSHFPPEVVLVYGFLFTTLLAFAYIPVQSALAAYGRRIREEAWPTRKLTRLNASKWQSERATLDEILQLKVGAGANFRATIAVLTPLIGALTTLLFNKGS